jgi:hypothetical protein
MSNFYDLARFRVHGSRRISPGPVLPSAGQRLCSDPVQAYAVMLGEFTHRATHTCARLRLLSPLPRAIRPFAAPACEQAATQDRTDSMPACEKSPAGGSRLAAICRLPLSDHRYSIDRLMGKHHLVAAHYQGGSLRSRSERRCHRRL